VRTVTHSDRESWLEWRRGGVTATDAAVIAGHKRNPTRAELWLEKIGKGLARDTPTESMQFGLLLEDDIMEMYERKTCEVISARQVCGEAEDAGFPMRATLDGMTDSGKIVECKAIGVYASRNWPEDGDSDNIPIEVFFQVQHQMRVADVDRCDVLAFVPLELRVYPVSRNDEIMLMLIALEREFWDCVVAKMPPPYLDDRDAEPMIRAMGVHDRTVGLSAEVQEVVDDYESICEMLKELEADKKLHRERILSAMSSNRYGALPDGRIVDCNLIQVAERTQVVKAHQQIRLSIKRPKF
jgi:putative phage-type endonuclease